MIEHKRAPRSSAYQWRIVEINYPVEILDIFTIDQSLSKRLNPFQYDERILELQDRLTMVLWKLLEANLTKRQIQIVRLLAQGFSQDDVAKSLFINQSSITKSINGNVDYSEGKAGKSYGGIKKKMMKIFEEDSEVQSILKQISDLREETWW